MSNDKQTARQRERLLRCVDTALADAQVFSANMDMLYAIPDLSHYARFHQQIGMMAQGSSWFCETLSQKMTEMGQTPLSYDVNRFRADLKPIEPTFDFNEAAKRTTANLAHLLKSIKKLAEAAETADDDTLTQLTKQSLQIVAGNIWVIQSIRQSVMN